MARPKSDASKLRHEWPGIGFTEYRGKRVIVEDEK